MSPDRRNPAAILTSPWGTLGDLAVAAFVLAALSGAAVVVPYDARDAYGSIAALLLANPPGAFFRNVHYWAGQLCLVLTVLHVWDHLRARTEHVVTRGVWLRLAMALPLVAFIMLSGFLLRGDADARQALRILAEATSQAPAIGPLLATLLLGGGERLDVVYVQHAATATIAVWLVVIEHARRGVWPRTSAFVAVAVAAGGLSLILSPGLHDGLDPVVKGPWYFLGLQEILHWTPWPLIVVLAGLVLIGAFYAVRVMPASRAAWTKRVMLGLLLVYAGLCCIGGFLRGENWAWGPAWPAGAGNLRAGLVFGPTPDAPATLPAPLPAVLGRPEGCLVCHAGVAGLGPSHRPDAVGCASCHGGDVFTLQKARAHAGMDVIPGNLATARRGCGQAACHASIIPRVERSVMATMSGIVAVNRSVFGERRRRAPDWHTSTTSAPPPQTRTCASCVHPATLAPPRPPWVPTARAPEAVDATPVTWCTARMRSASWRATRFRQRAGVPNRPASTRRCRSTSATASVSAATAVRGASPRATKAGTKCTNLQPARPAAGRPRHRGFARSKTNGCSSASCRTSTSSAVSIASIAIRRSR